jgi:hypothetical protein
MGFRSVPYTFLVSAVDKGTVDEALEALKGDLSDRGEVLVKICAKALEVLYGKT